jgi:hypothetical protein
LYFAGSRKGSIVGLVIALAAGALYIAENVTTSVSSNIIDLITQFVALQYPTLKNLIIPIIKTLTTLGGIGIILGGIASFAGAKRIGGYVILLSALGGIISYGTRLFTAYQSGLLGGAASDVFVFMRGMGLGLVAVALSLVAYMMLR